MVVLWQFWNLIIIAVSQEIHPWPHELPKILVSPKLLPDPQSPWPPSYSPNLVLEPTFLQKLLYCLSYQQSIWKRRLINDWHIYKSCYCFYEYYSISSASIEYVTYSDIYAATGFPKSKSDGTVELVYVYFSFILSYMHLVNASIKPKD